MTQIASHEWPGVLLAYLIAIQTSQGRRLLNTRLEDDDKKYNEKVSKANKQARFIKKREKVLKKHNLLSQKDRFSLQKRCRNQDAANADDHDNSSESDDSEEDSSSDCEDEFIIVSEEDRNNRDNRTRCTLENIVQLFEMILCFHAFYKNSKYWTIGDESAYKRFDQGIRTLMKQLITSLKLPPEIFRHLTEN
jgi:hypothetical protein